MSAVTIEEAGRTSIFGRITSRRRLARPRQDRGADSAAHDRSFGRHWWPFSNDARTPSPVTSRLRHPAGYPAGRGDLVESHSTMYPVFDECWLDDLCQDVPADSALFFS